MADANHRLWNAARSGDIGGVRSALADGANNFGEALVEASRNNFLAAAAYLLDRGADVHFSDDLPLRRAAEHGHAETVRLLLERGANIHAHDEYALNQAAVNGQPETVRLLLDQGADAFFNTDHVLCWSARYGQAEVVRLLLERGVRDTRGQARQWAAERGHVKVVALLEETERAQREAEAIVSA
jgi:ankyrin repeat protein